MVILKTTQSKMNQLDIKLFVNDNVLCFCDPVADVLLVAMKYCTGELNKIPVLNNVPNNIPKLRICSHLLKKSLIRNFISSATHAVL